MATPKDNKQNETKTGGVKKTTSQKKVSSSSTKDAVMSKAKSKLQKEAAAKKQSTKPKSPTAIKSQTSGSKTVHREVVVPSRKEVRGIPTAKLTVFTRGDSSPSLDKKEEVKKDVKDVSSKKENKDLNLKDKKVTKEKEEPKTTKKNESAVQKADLSKSKSIKSKQSLKVPLQKPSALKKKTDTTTQKPKATQKPIEKKQVKKKPVVKKTIEKKPVIKKTAGKKSRELKKKTPAKKTKAKKKIISKTKVFLVSAFILGVFLLVFLISKTVENHSLIERAKNNNSFNSIRAASIIEPKLTNGGESEYIYIGDSIKDLDSLNKTVEKIESNTLEGDVSVVNIEDENLSGDYIKLTIDKGLSALAIASLLQENGVCDKDLFLNYVVENNLETKLRSGTYLIKKNSSIKEIVLSIVETDFTTVTIYPASTIDQVDQILANRNMIKSGEFVEACTNACRERGLTFVEGWFTPATYKITNTFNVDLLASTMLDNTFKIISPYLKDIAKSGYSINDIIVISSLIQGETQDVSQMPIISSVIHNRLKKDMPLGIDATTRYELGDWTSSLSQEVLDKQTPYNTRRKKGLPPSGICFSSKDAIVSAIYPSKSDYLYYIHDKEGRLIPALDYNEHLKNIEKGDNNK